MHILMILLAAPAMPLLNWDYPLVPPLYLGPETIMPLASILAAIVGFLLIFWRMIVKFIKKTWRSVTRQHAEPAASNPVDGGTESQTEERTL